MNPLPLGVFCLGPFIVIFCSRLINEIYIPFLIPFVYLFQCTVLGNFLPPPFSMAHRIYLFMWYIRKEYTAMDKELGELEASRAKQKYKAIFRKRRLMGLEKRFDEKE